SDGSSGDSQRSYELKCQTNGTVLFAVYFELPVGATDPHFVEIGAPVSANVWTHLAASYSSAVGLKLYTNGSLAYASPSYNGLRLRQSSVPLTFGGTSFSG